MLLFNEAILHNKTVHSGVMWVPGLPRELILEFCCQFTNSKLWNFFFNFFDYEGHSNRNFSQGFLFLSRKA